MNASVDADTPYVIREPSLEDAPQIAALIRAASRRGDVLPRTAAEIRRNIKLFQVYVDGDGVGGCCALHPDTPELAEIRSIVVRENLQGRGVGSKLVERCAEIAMGLGIQRIYALTRAREFFARLGFREIDMGQLPSKVFKDCLRCRLYPHCDEIAMMRDL